MSDTWRGHEIVETSPRFWVYADTGGAVADDPDRPCGHCGLPNTNEGYDGCLGAISGAQNACCGHGNPELAYVQWVPALRTSVHRQEVG